MTLRIRLGLGFVCIAIVLLVPLLAALRSLEQLRDSTRSLRDREFAATLLVGRMRESAEQLDQQKNILALFPTEERRAQFEQRLGVLDAQADSLDALRVTAATRSLHAPLDTIRRRTPEVYRLASAGRGAAADSLLDKILAPGLAHVRNIVSATEGSLRASTGRQVEEFADVADNARRFASFSLASALAFALLIALWLTGSISRPVEELDDGMQAVAEGNFTVPLRVSSRRSDEFGRLAKSYDSMVAQLAQLDRMKAEFVSVASHELKTPINVILGYLQLLQEDIYGPVTTQQREILQTLAGQTQSLSRLVRQLLDVSRFEAGGGKLDVREFQLVPFFEELEQSFRVLAIQRGIAFRVTRRGVLPAAVLWDRDRIDEVVGNLLSNAFKFTARGGEVELTAERDKTGSVVIQVRDTGAGIPADQLPFVFEKFYQGSTQVELGQKGAGLGLTIAKSIVEAHGGQIGVASMEGQGTTFTLSLPTHVVARKTPAPGMLAPT